MHPLDIRDRRFWLQKELEGLEEGDERAAELEEKIAALQELCPHEHDEEDPEEGLWRCRDCDLQRRTEKADSDEEAEESEG